MYLEAPDKEKKSKQFYLEKKNFNANDIYFNSGHIFS